MLVVGIAQVIAKNPAPGNARPKACAALKGKEVEPNLKWCKALYFGLPVKIAVDYSTNEICVDSGFFVGLLLPMLHWIEARHQDHFKFAIYPDRVWYPKALYYWLFKPEIFDRMHD